MNDSLFRPLPAAGTFLLAALLSCSPVPQVTQDPMVLRYDKPADYFEEALPIGNGRIGASVYSGIGTDRLSLNDITLWTGEPDRGKDHPDIARGIGDEAAATLPLIREALEREDYALANELQKKVQGHFSESYQPLGTLLIQYDTLRTPAGAPVPASGYRRSLDLDSAIVRAGVMLGGQERTTEYFASAPDSVIVIRIRSAQPFSATLALTHPTPHARVTAMADGTLSQEGYVAYHAYPSYYRMEGERRLYDPARGTRFRTLLGASSEDGTVTPTQCLLPGGQTPADALRVEGSTCLTLYLVNATSFNGFDKDPAREGKDYRALSERNLRRCREKGYAGILASHLADYAALFGRVKLNLGETAPEVAALPTDQQLRHYTDLEERNPQLEALYYQYGRYLLIASSRTPGVPANLQGLWNERLDPPWSCNYTVNINLEENYWPAETAALPEMHAVLLSYLHNLSRTGAATARHYYGIGRGWACGHNSDIWAMTCPVGLETGDPMWANWNLGGAWLSTDIWERYLFTRDRDELVRNFPVLKGAALFCLDALVEKKDPETGETELITSPSTSPENAFVTPDGYVGPTLYGATADLVLIRECLQDAVCAARVVGGEEAFIREAEAALPRLRGYRTDHEGKLREWYHDWADQDPHHRHQSHLVGVFPGHQISPETTPELARAAARTLEIRGLETTGWSAGWRVNMLAHLQDADGAYRMLRRLLCYVSPDAYRGPDARRGGGTYPNLLDAHSPFQIDGNFGGCSGIMEMLLQSEADGMVRKLPALPAQWPEGGISGIRTRGGKTVTMTWRDGRVTAYREK